MITPDTNFFCGGGATFYGRYFKCHVGGPHHSISLRRAIEKSCNVYFYSVGNLLGVDRMHKWASALGLGEMSGIDLPSEIQGIMPSTAWKRQKYNEKWYAGETISVSIGQGQVSVTPISLAVMAMTVANGGTRHQPHLVRAIDDGNGGGWKPYPAPKPRSVATMKQSTIDAVHDGLFLVVNGAGTARRALVEGRDVAGKTGTAQVISNQGKLRAGKTGRDLRDHGFFVFFAPAKNPEIAGVVFAEHSEHGSSAAPIAKYMIETYFAKKEGKPMPAVPGSRQEPAAGAARRGCRDRQRARARRADPHRAARRAGRPPGRPPRRQLRAGADVRRAPPPAPHRLAAPDGRPGPGRHRPGDDLQRHLEPACGPEAGAVGPRFWTHLYAFGIGVGALFVCLFLDYRRLCENSLFIYLGVAARC